MTPPKTWAQIATTLHRRAHEAQMWLCEQRPRQSHHRELRDGLRQLVGEHVSAGYQRMDIMKYALILGPKHGAMVRRWEMKMAIRSFTRALRLVQAYRALIGSSEGRSTS